MVASKCAKDVAGALVPPGARLRRPILGRFGARLRRARSASAATGSAGAHGFDGGTAAAVSHDVGPVHVEMPVAHADPLHALAPAAHAHA